MSHQEKVKKLSHATVIIRSYYNELAARDCDNSDIHDIINLINKYIMATSDDCEHMNIVSPEIEVEEVKAEENEKTQIEKTDETTAGNAELEKQSEEISEGYDEEDGVDFSDIDNEEKMNGEEVKNNLGEVKEETTVWYDSSQSGKGANGNDVANDTNPGIADILIAKDSNGQNALIGANDAFANGDSQNYFSSNKVLSIISQNIYDMEYIFIQTSQKQNQINFTDSWSDYFVNGTIKKNAFKDGDDVVSVLSNSNAYFKVSDLDDYSLKIDTVKTPNDIINNKDDTVNYDKAYIDRDTDVADYDGADKNSAANYLFGYQHSVQDVKINGTTYHFISNLGSNNSNSILSMFGWDNTQIRRYHIEYGVMFIELLSLAIVFCISALKIVKNASIGIDDVTEIQLYLCGSIGLSDTSLADFNGSGRVDIFDCTDIQMYCNETLKIYGSYLYTPDYTNNTAEIYAYQGKGSEITLPSYAYGWNYKFTSVKNSAFRENKTITKLVVPSSYTSLGYYSFADCPNLQYVRIMNSRCHIDFSTFDNCDNLSEWIVG